MKHKRKNLIFIVAVAVLALLMSVGFFASADDEGLAEIEGSDFLVAGDEANYDFADGVLTVKGGNVTVRNKDVDAETTDRIVVDGDATVVLAGVNIKLPEQSNTTPVVPILINPGKNVVIDLSNGSYNKVAGQFMMHDGNKISGSAGVEVGMDTELGDDGKYVGTNFATLTITGNGTLEARGGKNAAGIGGSKLLGNSCAHGNIIIESGTIIAEGGSGGAGIGTASNMNSQLSNGSYKSSFNWGEIIINGGNITATGTGNGAGIGGGNHVDSGKITINGGVIDAKGDSGIGSGLGSSNPDGYSEGDKGPGCYYADITINGGTITAFATNNMGAGIGGGMYGDAIVTITGGKIDASVTPEGKEYQGGAGIGGGYQGCAIVKISGDAEVTAHGGNGAPGIGNGAGAATISTKKYSNDEWSGTKKIRTGAYTIEGSESGVEISGGTVKAYGGKFGAGIGTGNFTEWSNVVISGGKIYAEGYLSSEEEMLGGAGIGSGLPYVPSKVDYMVQTHTNVEITGGEVIAIGGWGASGVGSGSDGVRNEDGTLARPAGKQLMAETINIDFTKADVQAYADGTKFAIDTRVLNEDGTTTSYTEGRTVIGNMLQGTFVHAYENGEMDQNPEGLKSIEIINDATGEDKELTKMPDGYRSYATNVSEPGVYTVYTDEESIGKGEGRFFSKQSTDVFNKAEADQPGNTVQYTVETGKLSDNFYLFPVKTVVVEKIVNGPEEGTEGLNETVYFALKIDTENVKEGEEDNFIKVNGTYFMKNGDAIWTESIDIVDGVPQSKAYFVNVDDRAYDVWEINGPDDTGSPQGGTFGSYELKSITTQHGGLIKATADGTAKGAFTVTKSDEGDKVKISAEVDFDKTEGLEWITVSLFADGKLCDGSSKSLSKDGEHTATWTVDKENDGEEIVYSIADTSNNAAISKDQWSDEVKIINTYTTFTPPVDIDVALTKEIEAYYKASKDARATAVFRVIVVDEADKKLADRYVSFVFDKAGEQTKTIAFKKLEGPVKLTIEEVYSSGYKGVLKGGTATKAEYDLAEMDLSKPVTIEATFVNTHEGKNKYTDGVINNYKDKQFDHKEGE